MYHQTSHALKMARSKDKEESLISTLEPELKPIFRYVFQHLSASEGTAYSTNDLVAIPDDNAFQDMRALHFNDSITILDNHDRDKPKRLHNIAQSILAGVSI